MDGNLVALDIHDMNFNELASLVRPKLHLLSREDESLGDYTNQNEAVVLVQYGMHLGDQELALL